MLMNKWCKGQILFYEAHLSVPYCFWCAGSLREESRQEYLSLLLQWAHEYESIRKNGFWSLCDSKSFRFSSEHCFRLYPYKLWTLIFRVCMETWQNSFLTLHLVLLFLRSSSQVMGILFFFFFPIAQFC